MVPDKTITTNKDEPDMTTPAKAGLSRNTMSFVGFALIFGSLASAVFLLMLDLSGAERRPYLGIFYMIVPAVLVPGLVLVPLGMTLERRRRRRDPQAGLKQYPRLDLNNPRHRRSAAFFVCVTVILVFASAVGSYRAYETTDSVVFCGEMCHTPMHPEFTAHDVSPHARVKCSDCHVGPTPAGYAAAKYAGIRRTWAELRGTYNRPIALPGRNLEPASETCELCHWPQQGFGNQLRNFDHFSFDEQNTPRQISMLMATGGGRLRSGQTVGIHWHADPANQITYVATDASRQTIPWVRLRDGKGNVVEYFAKDTTMPLQDIQRSEKHQIGDCIDCHNRAGHLFLTPDRAVDDALVTGRLDRTLPFVKQQAVIVLSETYSTTEEAVGKIAAELDSYYHTNYAELYSNKRDLVTGAIAEIQNIYRANYFPEMKADWQAYPNNIGHFTSAGCFRCHDDQHVSADGKVISKDCNLCHTVNAQQEGGTLLASSPTKSFQHPVDIGDLRQVNCTDCHTGKGMAQ